MITQNQTNNITMSENYKLARNNEGAASRIFHNVMTLVFGISQLIYMSNIGYAASSPNIEITHVVKENNVTPDKIYGVAMGGRTVYIYNDEGTSSESLTQVTESLQEILSDDYSIAHINSDGVIAGQWRKDGALFIMPGGADLGYVKKLQGQGNAMIKDYVTRGGSYLGICAGAYYGASYIEFNKGGELEVLGERELKLFDGKAIGPAIAKYSYENKSGARAAQIELKIPDNELNGELVSVYFNGGPYFMEKSDNYFITQATNFNSEYKQEYDANPDNDNIIPANQINSVNDDDASSDNRFIGYYRGVDYFLPAIAQIEYGRGAVILSGVHLEYNYKKLDSSDPHLQKITDQLSLDDSARYALLKLVCKQLGL